jgi:hypothetical protein
MNGRRVGTSARIQRARRKTISTRRQTAPEQKHTENAMLRKLSATLIATALIASPAFAAAGAAASTSAATTTKAPTNNAATPAGKPINTVKHQHKPLLRHHVAKNKRPRHVKLSAKRHHRQHIVVHSNKTIKTVKSAKTNKIHQSSKITKPNATHG